MGKRRICFPIIIILFLSISGCRHVDNAWYDRVEKVKESTIREIPMLGPVSEARSEVSGMAWCGTDLILLPQYPDRFIEDGSQHVFSIPEAEIATYLSGENLDGIEPKAIPFDGSGVETLVPGFEGFEAIAFNGEMFYVTIEARSEGEMMGYIVIGQVFGACESLVLQPMGLWQLEPQADMDNMSHETLVFYQDHIYAIYEANGVNVNPSPIARVFAWDLGPRPEEISLDRIEYRITDATEPDESGKFWAMNYFFPGDTDLRPADDRIAEKFGVGASHLKAEGVERIIALQITDDEVIIADEPPLYLELDGEESRNWEGIVRFEDGFLMVTDKFPTTLLAFVENINQ